MCGGGGGVCACVRERMCVHASACMLMYVYVSTQHRRMSESIDLHVMPTTRETMYRTGRV